MFPGIFIILACAVLVQSVCTRDKLELATSRYIAAQSTGQLSWLQTILSSNATYTENLATVNIHNSTLSQPLKIDHVHTIIDATSCATYSELIITSTTSPYNIGSQIRFDANGVNITSIDSIVTTTGDLFFSQFSPSHTLHQVLLEDWSPISTEARDTRAVIQAAADAYYKFFTNNSVAVPWGSPCTRLEGGSLTANGNCTVGFPDPSQTVATVGQRYVIDETIGAVEILSNFGGLGADTHEFRVENGKIVHIHSMTFCRSREFNCGLAMPDDLTQPVSS